MTAVLRCAVDAYAFAMPADDVRHVTRADQLRADDSSDGRVGALTLGGQQVPVFDLGAVLGLRAAHVRADGDQHIAVTAEGGRLAGWLVDRLTRDLASSQSRIAALPQVIGGTARRWFSGVVVSADRDAILLIDPTQIDPHSTQLPSRQEPSQVFSTPAIAIESPREPVAVVFSTAALPSTDADRFALSGRQIAAIVQPGHAIAVPGAASHVRGLTIWRNVVVPVIDFRDGAPAGDNERWLIARCGGVQHGLIALPISADVVMHRPTPEDRLVSGAQPAAFATGVFTVDGDRVALLDLDALLADTSAAEAA